MVEKLDISAIYIINHPNFVRNKFKSIPGEPREQHLGEV